MLRVPTKPAHQLMLVFAVALAVRVLAELALSSAIPAWTSGSSMEYRIGLAESIMRGEGFAFQGIPNVYQTPAYPAFLAILFTLFGKHWLAFVLAQAVLDSLSCVGIALIGRRFSAYGWAAGLIFAIYPYAILQSRSVIDTTPFIFLFIWSIVAFLQFADTRRLRYLVMGAISLGVGASMRPSILPVALGLVAWLVFSRMPLKQVVSYTVIAGVLSAALPFAWTVRNYMLTGEFPVFTVGGTHTVWYGHNRHVLTIYRNGDSPDEVGRNPRYPMTPNIQVSTFFAAQPREQLELGRLCLAEAAEWRAAHPWETFQYTLLKLKTILSWEYSPRAIGAPFHEARLWLYRLTNGPIIVLGWLGLLILALRKDRYAVFMWTIAATFVAMHAATLVVSRHKLPLDAFLTAFIPCSLEYLRALVRGRGREWLRMRPPA